MLHPLTHHHPTSLVNPAEIERGLLGAVRTLPSKLFYDERGSALFERITALPEYYLTRTEQAIMDASVGEICTEIGPGALLVELGSGSSRKTRALLDRLVEPAGYVPVDISEVHLLESARRIAARYPHVHVLPVCADYERDFTLPDPPAPPRKTVVYYPGSTIGNFHPDDAAGFLRRIRSICGGLAEILIGVDLKKDPGLLHRAYNDCDGVTAEFNLNILAHVNEAYGADFDLARWEHEAVYNPDAGRIEMYLCSRTDQEVRLNEARIRFTAGERIWTESSYKYTLADFTALAARAGLATRRVWMDHNRLFSVQYLEG
jgi:dimethylhistidine N-methyltransferase